jgi:hypothetical protein
MNSKQLPFAAERSPVGLRDALQQARFMAESLTRDPLIGHEARALLGRLEAVGAELDAIQAVRSALKEARNDPDWTETHRIWS